MDPSDTPDLDEDIDTTLRHVSRQLPGVFARALLPPPMNVTSVTWLDTQIASRQRRLDRVLDVVADGRRRLEHVEWQLKWADDVPERVFEYHFLTALAVTAETPRDQPRPTVRTTVVLLSGRETPWPSRGQYNTNPEDYPFTGVVFDIDAVYQRTVAELDARASPFWLIFAPLAVDADPAGMARAVQSLRRRAQGDVLTELLIAMIVMADMDKRRRNLRKAILPLLKEETVMQNWIFKQGEAHGRAQGEAHGRAQGEANALLRILERRTVAVPDDVRARILACTDIPQLGTWLDRAATATRIEDVFAEPAG